MDYGEKVMEFETFSPEISGRKVLTYDDVLALLIGTTDSVKDKLNYLYDIIRVLSFIDPTRRDYLNELDRYLGEATMPMEDFLDTLEAYQEDSGKKSNVHKTHDPIFDSDDYSDPIFDSSDDPNV